MYALTHSLRMMSALPVFLLSRFLGGALESSGPVSRLGSFSKMGDGGTRELTLNDTA